MKEVPQPIALQNEEHVLQSMIGQDPPADAIFWGRTGRPDYFADIYLWQDKVIYANGLTKKIYQVTPNDGSMKPR